MHLGVCGCRASPPHQQASSEAHLRQGSARLRVAPQSEFPQRRHPPSPLPPPPPGSDSSETSPRRVTSRSWAPAPQRRRRCSAGRRRGAGTQPAPNTPAERQLPAEKLRPDRRRAREGYLRSAPKGRRAAPQAAPSRNAEPAPAAARERAASPAWRPDVPGGPGARLPGPPTHAQPAQEQERPWPPPPPGARALRRGETGAGRHGPLESCGSFCSLAVWAQAGSTCW